MGNVVHHPAFSDKAVVNGRHRGSYPKRVTSLRVYQRDRRNNQAELACAQTVEQQLAEANRILQEVSHHLVMAARAIARQSKT